jgi:hypothetical protein
MVPRHPIYIRIFICFISGFSCILNANSNVPDAGFTGEQKQTDEKLKLSYLCFRKDNLPTHIFNYFLQKENTTDNLLYVEDILNDQNDTLRYFLSFATNEQIWGTEDDQIVKSTIQLDPYFKKNSDRFLREKAFFEINRRIAETRQQTEIDKIKNKSSNQTSEKSISPITENSKVPYESMSPTPTTKESDATSLATYLLIIGAVCLVVTGLKKAFS